MGKQGVLLINIGTPDEPTVESVRRYLREFLLDPDVIDIPAPLRHLLVRGIILRTRPRKIAPRYSDIWMEDGSPLRVYTQRMADALRDNLGDVECEVGMRYGNPSIKYALEKLMDVGVDNLLIAPLFPQHAQATTESSTKEAVRQLELLGWKPNLFEIGHFEEDSSFIGPLAESIRPYIDGKKHLLFSYHGLPVSHIRRCDKSGSHCLKVDSCCSVRLPENSMCYAHHCNLTTQAVTSLLGLSDSDFSISYQSRLGPAKWLDPSTISKVEELAKSGRKDIVIVSPAFLADGLETLEELDLEVREHFMAHGGENLVVVKCLNDDPNWIEGLGKIVRRAFKKPLLEN